MLEIDVRTRLDPLILRPGSTCISGSGEERTIPVVGVVTIRSDHRREIGGVRVAWEVCVERRSLNSNHKGKNTWLPPVVLRCFELDVKEGMWVEEGTTEMDFVMIMPFTLPPTRTTEFDKLSHQLSAVMLDTSPCYDHIMRPSARSDMIQTPSSSRGSSRSASKNRDPHVKDRVHVGKSLLKRLRQLTLKASDGEEVQVEALTSCTRPIAVYTQVSDCLTHADFALTHKQSFQEYGSIELKLSSRELALCSPLTIDLKLTELRDDLTIHAVSADLRQTTICHGERPEDDRISIDKYSIYQIGNVIRMLAGPHRPSKYTWRGTSSRRLVSSVGQTSEKKSDSETSNSTPELGGITTVDDHSLAVSETTCTIHTRTRIPSPINGVSPTYQPLRYGLSPESPNYDLISVPATISHTLEITILYSILDEDSDGKIIAHSSALEASSPQKWEGAVRALSMPVSLNITSCMSPLSLKPPPSYTSDSPALSGCHVKEEEQVPSKFRVNQMKSIGTDSDRDMRWMRPVFWDEKDVSRKIRNHWDENGGRCLCFASRGQEWGQIEPEKSAFEPSSVMDPDGRENNQDMSYRKS